MAMPIFEIDRSESALLGRGSFGSVFRAVDTSSGEEVAAKLIDMNVMPKDAVMHEVQLLAWVRHERIVALRGVEDLGDEYVVFLDVAVDDLLERLMRVKVFDEATAARYFTDVASAVTHLHEMGVAHRDLKLENVLLYADGSAKLCDFGLAHTYEVDPASGELVREELTAFCGSKSYAAPELLARQAYDGLQVDLWSLGICLFTMLVGRFPFDEAGPNDRAFAHACKRLDRGSTLVRGTLETLQKHELLRQPLSDEVIDLLDILLNLAPGARGTARAALNFASTWATGDALRRGGGGRPRDEPQGDAVEPEPKRRRGASFASPPLSIDVGSASSVPSFGSSCPTPCRVQCSCPSYWQGMDLAAVAHCATVPTW